MRRLSTSSDVLTRTLAVSESLDLSPIAQKRHISFSKDDHEEIAFDPMISIGTDSAPRADLDLTIWQDRVCPKSQTRKNRYKSSLAELIRPTYMEGHLSGGYPTPRSRIATAEAIARRNALELAIHIAKYSNSGFVFTGLWPCDDQFQYLPHVGYANDDWMIHIDLLPNTGKAGATPAGHRINLALDKPPKESPPFAEIQGEDDEVLDFKVDFIEPPDTVIRREDVGEASGDSDADMSVVPAVQPPPESFGWNQARAPRSRRGRWKQRKKFLARQADCDCGEGECDETETFTEEQQTEQEHSQVDEDGQPRPEQDEQRTSQFNEYWNNVDNPEGDSDDESIS